MRAYYSATTTNCSEITVDLMYVGNVSHYEIERANWRLRMKEMKSEPAS